MIVFTRVWWDYDYEELVDLHLDLASAQAACPEKTPEDWHYYVEDPDARFDLRASAASRRSGEWRIYAVRLKVGDDPLKQLALKILAGDPQATDVAIDVLGRGG